MVRRESQKVLYGILLIALIAVAMILVIVIGYMGVGPFSFLRPAPSTTTPPPTVYKYTRPVKFTITDKWVGGGKPNTQVTVYKYATLENFDSGYANEDGIWTSTKAMTSGERYWVYLALSNAKIYYDITIPTYTTPNTESYHYIALDFYTMGTYAISLDDPTGAPITNSTGIYNVTATGNLFPTFTVMIRNTATGDSGALLPVPATAQSYYDPVKGLDREVVFVFKVSGSQFEQVIVKNYGVIYTYSNARFYGFVVNPEELIVDKKIGGGYVKGAVGDLDGIYTFNIQFDCSGMTPYSDGPTINFYLYTFENLNNFKTYGTFLSDDYSLASFQFEIDA